MQTSGHRCAVCLLSVFCLSACSCPLEMNMAPLSFPFFKSHRASLSADSNPEPRGQRDSGLSQASPLWCRGHALGTTENPGCPFTSIQAPRPSPPRWPPAHRSWTRGHRRGPLLAMPTVKLLLIHPSSSSFLDLLFFPFLLSGTTFPSSLLPRSQLQCPSLRDT